MNTRLISSVVCGWLLLGASGCGGGGGGSEPAPNPIYTTQVTCADGQIVDATSDSDFSNCPSNAKNLYLTAASPEGLATTTFKMSDEVRLTFNQPLKLEEHLFAISDSQACEVLVDGKSVGNCVLSPVSTDGLTYAVYQKDSLPVRSVDDGSIFYTEDARLFVFDYAKKYKVNYSVLSRYGNFKQSGSIEFTTETYLEDACPSPAKANHFNQCVYPIYGDLSVDSTPDKSGTGQNYWNPIHPAMKY